jgi:hypothetical protein
MEGQADADNNGFVSMTELRDYVIESVKKLSYDQYPQLPTAEKYLRFNVSDKK